MNLLIKSMSFCQFRNICAIIKYQQPVCHYAVKTAAGGSIMGLGKGKKGKLTGKMGAVEKIVLPVETDPEKLVNFVCGSNINVTGEDIKVKPDSEYPEWLWNLRTGSAPKIEELDPESREYWMRVRQAAMRRNNKLSKLKKLR